MHVLSCQWLPLTQEDKHTPDCLHLCAKQMRFVFVWTCTSECVCAYAYIWVGLCLCFLRINNAIQPYYESAEQTDTHCTQHTRSQTKHPGISESTYTCRMTRVRQSFWAKMATLDLNRSIRRALWDGGGRSLTMQPAPEQLPQQQQVEQLAGVAWLQ